MKAVICTKYGPPEVLRLGEVPKPAPKPNEVLIKVCASAVTASDIVIRSSSLPLRFRLPMRLALGLTKPRNPVIGMVAAGVVESVGKAVARFRPGDRVYGVTGLKLGAYAEYLCMRETDSMYGCLAPMPALIGYEEATAAAYGGLLALQRIEEGNVQPGQKVVVYGASGTSGTIAVQLAKARGADVTAVCSARHAAFVEGLGADRVIDYTDERADCGDERYDLMVDTAGSAKTSIIKEKCRQALRDNGKYVSIDHGKLELSSRRLAALAELIDAGTIKPVVDRVYPLERLAEAHAYVETGHKRGGVAITIAQADPE